MTEKDWTEELFILFFKEKEKEKEDCRKEEEEKNRGG